MNKYDSLLNLFISIDKHRPILQSPCKNDDYVVACDGHKAIKIPTQLLENNYEIIENYPNLQKIIDNAIKDHSCKGTIEYSELKEIFDSLQKIDDYGECDYCDGEGQHECPDCEKVHECGKCEGSGKGTEIIGKKYHENDDFQIGEAVFSAQSFESILKAFEIIGSKKINILAIAKEYSAIFEVNDIQLLAMPLRTICKSGKKLKLTMSYKNYNEINPAR